MEGEDPSPSSPRAGRAGWGSVGCLWQSPYGQKTVMSDISVDQKLTALREVRPWSPGLLDAFESLLSEGSDRELFRINPLSFADRHGLNEDESLDLFLHATHRGLLRHQWHILCPDCGSVWWSISMTSGPSIPVSAATSANGSWKRTSITSSRSARQSRRRFGASVTTTPRRSPSRTISSSTRSAMAGIVPMARPWSAHCGD